MYHSLEHIEPHSADPERPGNRGMDRYAILGEPPVVPERGLPVRVETTQPMTPGPL